MTRHSRSAVVLAVALLFGVGIAVIRTPPATAVHVGDIRLEVYREIQTAVLPSPGATGTIRYVARLMSEVGPIDYDNGASVEVDFEVESAAFDDEGGAVSYERPDAECSPELPPDQHVNGRGVGFPECFVEFDSGVTGTGLVRAWVDLDGFNNFGEHGAYEVEVDPREGRYSGEGDCDTEEPPPPDGSGASSTHVNPQEGAEDGSTFNDCTTTAAPGDIAEPDGTDVVQIAFSSVALDTALDCPPLTKVPRGGVGFVPCRVTDEAGNPRPGVRVDGEHLDGPNDPDPDDDEPNVADYNGDPSADDPECVSSASGICLVDIPSTGPSGGASEICFWLDEDNDDHDPNPPAPPNPALVDPSWGQDFTMNTSVADGSECASEPAAPLSDGGNAKTDRESVVWEDPMLTTLEVSPETARSTLPANHALEAVVLDQFSRPWPGGEQVRFEFLNGSPSDQDGSTLNSPDLACDPATSGESVGTCGVSYSGRALGTDTICAFVFVAGNNVNPSCNGETQPGNQGGGLVDVVIRQWVDVDPVRPAEQGYTLVGADGGIFNFGSSKFFGSMGDKKLNAPVITMAHLPGGEGYWLVASDGGVFTFGKAQFFGSMGDKKLNAPVIGMQPTPAGDGYWLYAADGGIFTFGKAQFFGSMGDKKLNAPVVGMTATTNGDGYWLVAQDGGVFTFGRAPFHGSTGNRKLNQPVFDLAPGPGDSGYWLVARDGGIFSFPEQTQPFYGSGVGQTQANVIGMDATPSRKGYWIADSSGKVQPFGDARFFGDRRNESENAPMVGFATVPR